MDGALCIAALCSSVGIQLCMTMRGQGTPDAVPRLSYKCLSFYYDLRDTIRVKPSFPHDIA